MNIRTNNMVKGGLLLAFGLVIPYIFHMVGMAGQIFLPMHIPVLISGLLLGSRYGLVVGALTPLLNSVLTGMPPIYPVAISMAFELAAYGFIAGLLYKNRKLNIWAALIIAMLAGRLVSGAANYVLLMAKGSPYLLKAFIGSAFITPIWGIILQLVLIPVIVKVLEKNQKQATFHG